MLRRARFFCNTLQKEFEKHFYSRSVSDCAVGSWIRKSVQKNDSENAVDFNLADTVFLLRLSQRYSPSNCSGVASIISKLETLPSAGLGVLAAALADAPFSSQAHQSLVEVFSEMLNRGKPKSTGNFCRAASKAVAFGRPLNQADKDLTEKTWKFLLADIVHTELEPDDLGKLLLAITANSSCLLDQAGYASATRRLFPQLPETLPLMSTHALLVTLQAVSVAPLTPGLSDAVGATRKALLQRVADLTASETATASRLLARIGGWNPGAYLLTDKIQKCRHEMSIHAIGELLVALKGHARFAVTLEPHVNKELLGRYVTATAGLNEDKVQDDESEITFQDALTASRVLWFNNAGPTATPDSIAASTRVINRWLSSNVSAPLAGGLDTLEFWRRLSDCEWESPAQQAGLSWALDQASFSLQHSPLIASFKGIAKDDWSACKIGQIPGLVNEAGTVAFFDDVRNPVGPRFEIRATRKKAVEINDGEVEKKATEGGVPRVMIDSVSWESRSAEDRLQFVKQPEVNPDIYLNDSPILKCEPYAFDSDVNKVPSRAFRFSIRRANSKL